MDKLAVIVPGYYGSKLYEVASNRLVWLDLGTLLKPGETTQDLRLDVGPPDRVQARGILDELVLLPFLAPDIYKKLIDFLRGNLHYAEEHIRAFYYDWRKSLTLAADTLHAQIERWVSETGAAKVDLIAHSYGGMVARAYLHRHAPGSLDRVDWLIALATPHRGMLKTFEALTRGINLATFSRAQSRVAARTFPSAYELVPHRADDGLFRWNGQPASALAEPAWTETPQMAGELAAAQGVITGQLPDQIPVKACLIYGTRLETSTFGEGAPGSQVRFTSDDRGDSTVPQISALGRGLTGAAALHRFPIPFGNHMMLFADPAVEDLLTDILRRDRVPQIHFCARFESGSFYHPLSVNRLVVELRDDAGQPLPGGQVQLRVLNPSPKTVAIPQQPEGDYVAQVKMPGAGSNFRCEITATSPALPQPRSQTFLLVARS